MEYCYLNEKRLTFLKKNASLCTFVVCLSLSALTFSSCNKDEDYNKADITFQWTGSEDFVSVVKPVVTWWVYPNNTSDGEEISSATWKKELHFENFDSILVYAVVTYPKPSQLPDVAGKELKMSHNSSGHVLAFDESHKLITSLPSDTEPVTEIVKGEQLDDYLNRLSGEIHQVGFVVYRDGRARVKYMYEEVNWKK